MDSPDDALRDYLALRNQINSAQLATLGAGQRPEASYAPLVWHQGACYLYLSELASHTQNLQRNPALGLLLVENGADQRNPFARRRISLEGRDSVIPRDSELFSRVLTEFRQRFGKVMQMIEPLPDFHLFRVDITAGRFIRGFAQAYELGGERLDELIHVDPGA